MNALGMNLINMKSILYFNKNFRITDNYMKNEIIKLEKFTINRNFKYLNIKLTSYLKANPHIFLLLVDSNNILRLQYLSINSKNNLLIGENEKECSIGAYPGVICKGEWKLILVNLENTKENIDYSINIEGRDQFINEEIDKLGENLWVNYNKEDKIMSLNNYDWDRSFSKISKWYKGDFHTHSILSDGKMNSEIYMNTAKEMNLDFTVTTEHNIIPTGWNYDEKILVIPGMEVTLRDGHFNILGIRKSPFELELMNKIIEKFKNFSLNGIDIKNDTHKLQESIAEEILNEYRDEDSIYSVNHMMLEFWKWKFENIRLDTIDTIEICNDPTYYLGAKSNDEVIKILDILWDDGHRVYGIGGSDAHILPNETYDNSNERSIIGDPSTFVYCNELTPKNIINSVKKGHVYVTRGLAIDIHIDVTDENEKKSYLPGDEIKIFNYGLINYSINITLENIKNSFGNINETNMPLKVWFVENGKIIKEVISKYGKVNFTTHWRKNEFRYLRVEVRDMKNKFKGYINPIYTGNKEHELITFKDLLKKYKGCSV